MSSTAKLGAFMLAALIVLGAFILNIEKISLGRAVGPTVKATFASVAGLDEKSPVRIAGVRVGIAEKISLEGGRAIVTLALEPGIEVRKGARATLRSQGLLGDEYVELDPGPAGNPPLPAGATIPGERPMGFDQVVDEAGRIGSDVKDVTASLRGALGGPEGERRLDDILENIRALTAEVRAMVAGNRAEVDATIANFRDFSTSLREDVPKLADKLTKLADDVDALVAANRGNVDATLANARDLTARLRVTADNLNEITGKIARGEGSVGKLVNDDETVDNLNSALKSVEGGVQSLRDTIGRAERWRLEVGLRSEALPRINDSRSEFGIDLRTSEKRFFRAGVVDAPQGKRRESTETVVETLPDGTVQTTATEKTRIDKAFTLNAQVGYLFGSNALRAGLFEGEGGVGIDRTLGNGRFGLTFEAFDFGRDVKAPHLRLEGRWFLNRNVFAYTGWDDPRWSQYSSAFVGMGVVWDDEDLKYLLPGAGSFAH